MITRLQAVNQILQAIGESPVASLSSGLDDSEFAESTLDRVSAEVQAKGWQCNTDLCLEMALDMEGHVPVPTNALRIDTVGHDACINVSVREIAKGQRALYNIREKTFKFSHALRCDVVWAFEFEDLTPELQTYVAAKAAREYQEAEMGSVTLDSFARGREAEAEAALMDAEAEAADSNTLRDNPFMARIANRNSYYYR